MQNLTKGDPRTYAFIGAAFEVHKQLGCGFSEPVYQEALAIEFSLRGIPFKREARIPILYKGVCLDTFFKPDFLCHDTVVIELKTLVRMTG